MAYPAPMTCDLHMHSTHSDGSHSIRALVEAVHDAGVTAFSLTDHDTVAGLDEARSLAAALDLQMINGIEVSTELDGMSVHILGYGFDPKDAGLVQMLNELQVSRQERIPRMVARLIALNVPVRVEEVLALAGEGSPGRPHVARALVDAGHCRDIQDAFTRFLGDGGRAHIAKDAPTPATAIAVLRRAGGMPIWAHPLARSVPRPGGVRALAKEMKASGLAGLEVIHPSHSSQGRRRLRKICRELNLLETGGSDFHGENTPGVQLGKGRDPEFVPLAIFESLKEACAPRAATSVPVGI